MKIKDAGDSHFNDFALTQEDRDIGEELAEAIGDTFICFEDLTPLQQWIRIAKALRIHGLQIKEVINAN